MDPGKTDTPNPPVLPKYPADITDGRQKVEQDILLIH